jgi:hypothetical protein
MHSKFSRILLGVLAGGTFALTGLAGVASADQSPSATGIEFCKVTAAPAVSLTVPFHFTVSQGGTQIGSTVAAPVNASTTNMICSQPVTGLSTGTYTVNEVEASQAWNKVNSITGLPGQNDISSPILTGIHAGQASVSVVNGSISAVVYSDSLITGYVEVCKAAATGSGLVQPASFNFTVTGGDGFSAPTSATVGECSPAMQVPAGSVQVAESGTPQQLFVSAITSPNGAALSNVSTVDGTVNVAVKASGDSSIQSDVTFTNNVVTLKVCKSWWSGDDAVSPTSTYPFTFSATGANVTDAGSAASGSLPTVPVGGCQVVGTYPAGTDVTVTEGIVAGTKVESIGAQDGASLVPGTTPSITGRSVQVQLGSSGEGLVNFTDTDAANGFLKLCVNGTSTAATPSVSFAVTGIASPTVVTQGQCVPVGGDLTPTPFAFNSNITVTGTASNGNSFVTSTVPTTPTDVWEVVGGVLTDTGVKTLVSGPTISGATNNVETEVVTISEGLYTEVTYTDPIATPTAITGPVVTTAPIPGGSVATSTSSSTGSSTSVVGLGQTQTSNGTTILVSTPQVLLTKAQIKAELKKFNKELTSLTAAERADAKKLTHLKGHARTRDASLVKKLQGEIRTVNAQIKALNKLNK